jgi:hypothetical protein
MLRGVFLFILVLSLAACTTTPVSVPKGLQGLPLGAGGLVFGSIGTGGDSHFSSYSLRYRAVGSKEEGEFTFRQSRLHIMRTTVDFEHDDATGSVFSVRLPSGDYQLFNVRFYESHGQYGDSTFTSKVEFPITFSIKEGKAVYLGEYLGQRYTGKNIFFIRVSAGGYFVVADQLERDMAVLQKRGESISRDATQNLVPSVLEANVPLLRKQPLPEQ